MAHNMFSPKSIGVGAIVVLAVSLIALQAG